MISTLVATIAILCACSDSPQAPPPKDDPDPKAPTRYTYNVLNVYPHDSAAFTQGLVYESGFLYEGTGQLGRSTLRRVELETGTVVLNHDLPAQYFGEGVTIFNDEIIQLTWLSNLGFVYDKTDFSELGRFNYPTEGWGITHDGTRLIMSDGSETIRFLDPKTFAQTGTITVTEDGNPIRNLNELEYVNGEIYANKWLTDWILRIDPETGNVNSRINLTNLLPIADRLGSGVLNGIAYDAPGDRLFVTGKNWPKLFHIELVPIEGE